MSRELETPEFIVGSSKEVDSDYDPAENSGSDEHSGTFSSSEGSDSDCSEDSFINECIETMDNSQAAPPNVSLPPQLPSMPQPIMSQQVSLKIHTNFSGANNM